MHLTVGFRQRTVAHVHLHGRGAAVDPLLLCSLRCLRWKRRKRRWTSYKMKTMQVLLFFFDSRWMQQIVPGAQNKHQRHRQMIKESPVFLEKHRDNTVEGLREERQTKDESTCRQRLKELHEKKNEDISRELRRKCVRRNQVLCAGRGHG